MNAEPKQVLAAAAALVNVMGLPDSKEVLQRIITAAQKGEIGAVLQPWIYDSMWLAPYAEWDLQKLGYPPPAIRRLYPDLEERGPAKLEGATYAFYEPVIEGKDTYWLFRWLIKNRLLHRTIGLKTLNWLFRNPSKIPPDSAPLREGKATLIGWKSAYIQGYGGHSHPHDQLYVPCLEFMPGETPRQNVAGGIVWKQFTTINVQRSDQYPTILTKA